MVQCYADRLKCPFFTRKVDTKIRSKADCWYLLSHFTSLLLMAEVPL